MVVHSDEPLLRVPMSWEEYLELPDRPKAEWVDGVAVIMNSPPLWTHSDMLARLCGVIFSAAPHLHSGTDASLVLPRNRVRRPDLMIIEAVPADGWVKDAPLMVAEVLSRSTRSEDLVRKSAEYLEAGIGQYWVLDPQLRTIEVMVSDAGAWRTALLLDDDHPDATVEVGGTSFRLDLRLLLRN